MALRATKQVDEAVLHEQDPAGERADTVNDGVCAPRAVPFDITALVAPYKKRGRLLLRIEKMAPLSRFSAGRNNGDGSWSLATDELEDLDYLLAEGRHRDHTLVLRIISLVNDAASALAVLDVPVSLSASGAGVVGAASGDAKSGGADPNELRRLQEELEKVRKELAERDAALESQLSAGLESQLAAAHEAWQRDADVTLSKAQESWKADEAKRMAAAEARWRQNAEKAAAEARGKAEASRDTSESAALATMRDEVKALRATLSAREKDLAETKAAAEAMGRRLEAAEAKKQNQKASADADADARRALEKELATLRTELAASKAAVTQTKDAMAKAAETAARETRDTLAKAETEWQRKLAQAGTETDRAAQKEIEALHATVSERDAALADAQAAAAKAAETAAREKHDALAKVEAEWQRKLAQAGSETERAAQEEIETLRATVSERDAALADAQAAMVNAMESAAQERQEALAKAEAERQRKQVPPDPDTDHALQEEVEALRALVSERDAALADAQDTIAQAAESAARERRDALADVEKMWAARAAEQVAATEVQWRDYSEKAIAEARASTAGHGALSPQDAAAADESAYRIVLKRNSEWDADDKEEAPPPRKQGSGNLVRDLVLAIGFGVAVLFSYPYVEPYLPPAVRVQIAQLMSTVTGAVQPLGKTGAAAPSVETPKPAAAARTEAAPTAIALRDANVRAKPENDAPIVATLARGLEVTVTGTEGNWIGVRVDGEAGAPPREGWVYKTLLQMSGEEPSDAADAR